MIDLERCRRAMKRVYIDGICNTAERANALADAIAAIQRDPINALMVEYIGIKNYSGFGDQREDHKYGYGPKHGTIVFRIGRHNREAPGELGADEIYFLECARDFAGIPSFWRSNMQEQRWIANLPTCITAMDRMQESVDTIEKAFIAFKPETHGAIPSGRTE
jgi:hypothetical protein